MTPMQFIAREALKGPLSEAVRIGRPQVLSGRDVLTWLAAHGPATTKQIAQALDVSKSVTNTRLREMGDRIETVVIPGMAVIRRVRGQS